MTLISAHRHIILILLLLVTKLGYSVYSDTTIVTRWRDNQKKVVTIYKIKRTQDKDGKTITVLKRKKEEKFYKPACDHVFDEEWDEVDKCEVSKADFERLYSEYDKIDSLNEIKRKTPRIRKIKKNVIAIRVGHENSRFGFPINLNIGDTNVYSYKKQDTVLSGKTYAFRIFMKDSLSQEINFTNAIRTDIWKVYSFNANTQTEELLVDVEAAAKEAGQKIGDAVEAFIQTFPKPNGSLLNSVKTGATKGLAFGLMNLMFIIR